MIVRNDNLIQKCFRKEWTLSEFLRQAKEEEIISVQRAGTVCDTMNLKMR